MVAFLRVYAAILALIGAYLAIGGFRLVQLGGSPYYMLAGAGLVAAGVLLLARRAEGAIVYFAILFATIVWALWEVGFSAWELVPRLLGPIVLSVPLLFPGFLRALQGRYAARPVPAGLAMIGAAVIGAPLHGLQTELPDPIFQAGVTDAAAQTAALASLDAQAVPDDGADWPVWGRGDGGSRFSPLTQITPENVADLEVAWTYRVGRDPLGNMPRLSVTPLKIDRTLYLCSAWNDVIALDAETGKERWRAGLDIETEPHGSCRGVAYYKATEAEGLCAERIITATVDVRLVALDARTGQRCVDFGDKGEVSLRAGMGDVPESYYYVVSAPAIVRGNIVIGGRVIDNQYWGEPSGVIRAFDAVTGDFSWAFDVGRLDRQSEPPEGETYTRSTPNSWAPMSVDEELGLVYVPTGSATNDYFGGHRRPFDERFANSTIAIDGETGKLRWSFQTSHHDLWDYDVPSQPVLADVKLPGGKVRRALVQATKRGELFVLDRATGKPLHPVVERPVPTSGQVREERVSPTQPFSVGMPSLSGPDLTERDMWGISLLDQLWCRIKFREVRYDGKLTPPGLTQSIIYPGTAGGSNWGSLTVDTDRNIIVANAVRMPYLVQLLPRSEADRQGLEPYDANGTKVFVGQGPQLGTPYAADIKPFLSPLQVPCSAPPFGTISGIDLASGKLIWTRKFGTAENSGPMGIPSFLPFEIGTPNLGGPIATRAGLTFIAATTESHFRAFDSRTGKVLWDTILPAAGHATPMTYMSPQSGRQFVVIAASGHKPLRSAIGDYIVAYALPEKPVSRE